MKLHDWLLSERYVTHVQYNDIIQQIFKNTRGTLKYDGNHLLISSRVPVLAPTEFHRHPVGEVIASMPLAQQVYQNADVADLPGLVAKWQRWHVDNLEPTVNYPTSNTYAQRLYENRVEKKLVANPVRLDYCTGHWCCQVRHRARVCGKGQGMAMWDTEGEEGRIGAATNAAAIVGTGIAR